MITISNGKGVIFALPFDLFYFAECYRTLRGYGTIAAISLEYVLSWLVESSAVTT
jgi:hypothetical protein